MEDFFGFALELLEKGRAQVGEPYADAELYDLLNQANQDLSFYLDFATKQGGRVLDLACGSGRLIPGLLDAGLDVTGLDLSPQMIARAREKLGERAAEVELVVGDMRSFSFQERFNTILIPYCSMIYMLTDEDRLAVFRACREHLLPGGYLVFDFLAGEVELGEGWPELALQGINPLTGEVLVSVVQLKGEAPDQRLLNQINYVHQAQGGAAITVYSSREAVVKPDHMLDLLQQAGFAIEGVFTASTGQEYAGGEDCLIVARR